MLAKRIKETAQFYRLRKNTEPTIAQIKDCLKEFNPIIVSEAPGHFRYQYNSHQNFSVQSVRTVHGYHFQEICRAVYKLLCLKRALYKNEVKRIAQTSTTHYHGMDAYIDTHFVEENQRTTQSRTVIPEIGLEDLENVRRRIEASGGNNIPNAMREQNPIRLNEELNPIRLNEELNPELMNITFRYDIMHEGTDEIRSTPESMRIINEVNRGIRITEPYNIDNNEENRILEEAHRTIETLITE